MKELVDLGPSATLPICEALSETSSDFHIRFFGFALRALNDPRSVPTLIETVPKTLFGPSSDMGLQIADNELNKFMIEHDLSPDDPLGGSFGFGRPCREVVGALERITGHKFEQSTLTSVMLSGGPLARYYQKKTYYDYAVYLREWWEENYSDVGADMGFVNVELDEFDLEKPEAINVFEQASTRVAIGMRGLIIAPPSRERYVCCFYDLDRGVRTGLGDSYEGPLDDLVAIEKWAVANNFDLMGIYDKLDAYDESQFMIKGLGIKFWQQREDLYQSIGDGFSFGDLELGEPRKGLLMHLNGDKYDPNRKATFLYQTSEGTCGAILLVSQVTRLLEKGEARSSSEVNEDEGFFKGVKINLKTIFAIADE